MSSLTNVRSLITRVCPFRGTRSRSGSSHSTASLKRKGTVDRVLICQPKPQRLTFAETEGEIMKLNHLPAYNVKSTSYNDQSTT